MRRILFIPSFIQPYIHLNIPHYIALFQFHVVRVGNGREFRDFFAALPTKTLVFGDRFPLRYFAETYGLTCYAAFPGCATQTEPSAATVAFLTEKVESEGISTVFYIEFSNHLVADSIAEAAGARTALFHSCHNVSRQDLESGATYLSLMRQNLETLRACLP